MASTRLILASASPRRAQLLRAMGLEFEIRPADCDERWLAGETPVAYARRVARSKLEAVLRTPTQRRLAADTTVWIDAETAPLGKPTTRDEARQMLERLSRAETHQVTTAFAFDGAAGVEVEHVTTRVHFRSLGHAELERYLDGDEWRDKAGGYGIQASAASFVIRIEGSYTNVVGLPLAELSSWLLDENEDEDEDENEGRGAG